MAFNRTVNNEGGLSAQDSLTHQQEFLTTSSVNGSQALDVFSLNGGLAPAIDFDLITVTATDSDTDTLAYTKTSSPVLTVTVNYRSSGVEKISDTFSSIGYA